MGSVDSAPFPGSAELGSAGVCDPEKVRSAVLRFTSGDQAEAEIWLCIVLDGVRELVKNGAVGDAFDIIQAVSGALASDVVSVSLDMELRVRNHHAICLSKVGDFVGALNCYARAIETAQTAGATSHEARLWLNLGVAATDVGLYAEARTCYAHAAAVIEQTDVADDDKLHAYANLAYGCIRVGEPARGFERIRRALAAPAQLETDDSLSSRIYALKAYSQLCVEIGDYAEALQSAEAAQSLAKRCGSVKSRVEAATAKGIAVAYAGEIKRGIGTIEAALSFSDEHGLDPTETLAALSKLAAKAGDYARLELYSARIQAVLEQRHGDHLRLLVESREKLGGLPARIVDAQLDILTQAAATYELRDDPSGLHAYRVGSLARLIAIRMGQSEQYALQLEQASRLHDIGKCVIPDAVMLKTSALSATDRTIVMEHSNAGARIIESCGVKCEVLEMAAVVARCHHEAWDGSGYPAGLAGTAIPLSARIVAVADVLDSLTHAHHYRDEWACDAALLEVLALRGSAFDPAVGDAAIAVVSDLAAQCGDIDICLLQGAENSPFTSMRNRINEIVSKARPSQPVTTIQRRRRAYH